MSFSLICEELIFLIHKSEVSTLFCKMKTCFEILALTGSHVKEVCSLEAKSSRHWRSGERYLNPCKKALLLFFNIAVNLRVIS